jgi:hypothetical protein
MPLHVPTLTDREIQVLEDWITAGAPNGSFQDRGDGPSPPRTRSFEADVRPIFGVEEELNRVNGVCRPAQGQCAHCIYCHYAGTPNPPNLSDPFGPDGIVNVTAYLRSDMKRVAPGDPEGSLLIHKVRPNQSVDEFGPRMPYSYAVLTPDQVDLVRQWITEGARP